MLFVLNRLPSNRDEALAIVTDFASRLYENGLLLEPDAAMVFGIDEARGYRWHGGLDPSSVGALRNELGAVSNSGYRDTLISTTAYTTGRNVVDRCRLVTEELERVLAISAQLRSAVDDSYQGQADDIARMLADGALRDMARHSSWSAAAVDLTAIITRRAGVAAQQAARSWTHDRTGSLLLQGEGITLWRHTEDTSWDVQGRLEEWEVTLRDVATRHASKGSLSNRRGKKLVANTWRLLVDPGEKAPRTVRRTIKGNLAEFVDEARASLSTAVAEALDVDAGRFRRYLETDPELVAQIEHTITAISALLHGEPPRLESVPKSPGTPRESDHERADDA